MSSDWEDVALGDVVGAVNTGLDAIKRAPIVDVNTGIKCLRIQDVSQSKRFSDWGNTDVRAQDFDKYRLRKNEIIMARTCSPGICLLVKSDMQAVFNNGLARVRAIESKILPSFLFYIFKSQDFAEYIYGISHGTSVQLNMKVGDLTKYKVRLPPISIQQEIASLLSLLDDRITLLRETNATLEAIAQALFKSWFVDFDPVRAKAEGRQPEGMDTTTAALFPDSFEESELGLVPKGWDEVRLGQICTFQKGCSYKGNGLSDEQGAYMFNLGCFNAPRVYAFEKVKRYTGDFKDKHRVKAGDLIIANTDMTQHRAILGRPLLIPEGMGPGFVSHHVFKVMTNKEYGGRIRPFLFFCFLHSSFRERAVGYATGTTVLALPRDALEQHIIYLPSNELLEVFADLCEPVFAAIMSSEVQTQTLTQLRDTLLPRLISGQLRLPEAEALVMKAEA